MNNRFRYIEPETHPTNRKTRLLRIPRPYTGAVIGFASFLLFTTPYLLSGIFPNSYFFDFFLFINVLLLGPGLLVFFILAPLIGLVGGLLGLYGNSTELLFIIIVFGAASIPPTTIGYLLASHDKSRKRTGIIFLVLYTLILVIGATFWLNLWSV